MMEHPRDNSKGNPVAGLDRLLAELQRLSSSLPVPSLRPVLELFQKMVEEAKRLFLAERRTFSEKIDEVKKELRTLDSRTTDLENHRIKNDERREVAIDLLEMVANDVSKLKQQSEDYEQAFDLASTEIDNLKREVQLLEQTSPHQPETSPAQSSKEASEKEEFVRRLTDDAVHACQNQLVMVVFEALSQGQSAPSGIWPADWDVAIIVREFDRRAANVKSS